MENSPPSPSRTQRAPLAGRHDPLPRGRDAFTLVEISVVVMIIGMLATMALPALQRAGDAAKINTYVNDLRVFSAAFDQYAQIHGGWPDTQRTAQSFPAGMEGHLGNSSWTRLSPIGGSPAWERNVVQNGREITAAISLVDTAERPVSATSLQLTEIDRKIDDGNLATGMFQLGFGNLPIYIVDGTTEPGTAEPPPEPPPSSGGGAFDGWFSGALLLLGLARLMRRQERSSS